MRSIDHKPKLRLHCSEQLTAAKSLTLSRRQAHYLSRVMRVSVGDSVALFNADCGEWHAEIQSVKRDRIEIALRECLRPPSREFGPTLIFAAIKKDGMDFIAIKATELGVGRLSPVTTDRSIVSRVNHDRLLANAVEAAEQCGRLSIPRVDPVRKLDDTLATWAAVTPLFALSPKGGVPIYDAFRRMVESATDAPHDPCFLVGPEGGFSPVEESRFEALSGLCRVAMGHRILRAETAALAVLACWQAIVGDWRADQTAR